ncbi:amidase domain-containing protein [Agromyces sp. CCNWLW203]|uniref:amidase domain-containing protein n=1 Tax=Agromyces sp. CCNWLW203 TaxID=3112842 RepID=UPI002F964E46
MPAEPPARRRSTYRAPSSGDAPIEVDTAHPAGDVTDDATRVDAVQVDAAELERRAERRARHRAERVRNRRPSSGAPRRFMALGCASAILSVSAFGAVAAASADDESRLAATSVSDADTSAASAAASRDVISAPVSIAKRPAVTSGLSTAAAPFTGGTQVTVAGEQLDQVAQVAVGGVAAPIVAATPEQLTFQVPAVADTALGAVAVAFTDAAGAPIAVAAPGTATVAGAAAPASLAAQLTEIDEAAVHAPTTSLTLTYTSNPAIDAQLGYVLTYWSSYNTAQYTVLSGVDCANFTSQSLVARGWAMDAGWYYDRATGAMSPSWASSTAMRDWLYTRPDLATPLDDSQRGLVKVGDIAQFDWDGSGDRDHTAIVTRVERTANGTAVWVGGHTKDADYWNVDEALASSGGSVTYFSVK